MLFKNSIHGAMCCYGHNVQYGFSATQIAHQNYSFYCPYYSFFKVHKILNKYKFLFFKNFSKGLRILLYM